MPAQPIQPLQDLEDAESVLHRATDPYYNDYDTPSPEQVAAAGLALREALRRTQRELEWARAVAHRETGRGTVPGGQLLLGEDGGGARYILNDEPIHAGSGLFLLTNAGWLPGRFEYTRTEGGEMVALFYFSLPGFRSYYGEVRVMLPLGARLAWPNDVKGC